jgi:hypothetical protein
MRELGSRTSNSLLFRRIISWIKRNGISFVINGKISLSFSFSCPNQLIACRNPDFTVNEKAYLAVKSIEALIAGYTCMCV